MNRRFLIAYVDKFGKIETIVSEFPEDKEINLKLIFELQDKHNHNHVLSITPLELNLNSNTDMTNQNDKDVTIRIIQELESLVQEIEDSKKIDDINGLNPNSFEAALFNGRKIGRERAKQILQNRIKTLEKGIGISTVNEFKRHEYTNQKLEYGKYIVVRKDGKKHLETYNNTGWAYNHDSIKYFYLPKFD